MTAPPEIAEQRAAEWWDAAWDCADCGRTCTGDPLGHWCEETNR